MVIVASVVVVHVQVLTLLAAVTVLLNATFRKVLAVDRAHGEDDVRVEARVQERRNSGNLIEDFAVRLFRTIAIHGLFVEAINEIGHPEDGEGHSDKDKNHSEATSLRSLSSVIGTLSRIVKHSMTALIKCHRYRDIESADHQ